MSEYVEGALDARMRREQWLARWRAAAGDVDPEALAYARRAGPLRAIDPDVEIEELPAP